MLFAAGAALVAAAVAAGDAEVSLFVVFPVISGSGGLFLLGAALVVAGFLAWFLALATAGAVGVPWQDTDAHDGTSNGRTKYGGVVLIGPVPIVFGSTRRLALAMLAIAVVTAIVLLGLIFLVG